VSACGRYRYLLSREAANEAIEGFRMAGRVAFLMLNPSTADAWVDDPTVRKCMGFVARWGYGAFDVVNTAAYRATDPSALYERLRAGEDVVGPDNARVVDATLRSASLVVLAWGANDVSRFPAAGEAYLRSLPSVVCLGRTSSGAPRHPLMIGYDTALEPYFAPAEQPRR
jgi:hypothetical protein